MEVMDQIDYLGETVVISWPAEMVRNLFYCGLGIDEVKDFNPKEGDRIIDNSTSGLHIGDEVGCEIGTGKDYDDFFEPPEEEIAEEPEGKTVEELANETGGSAPEIIAEVFEV